MIKLLEGYDYPYHITDDGRVFNKDKELVPINNGLGYLFIRLVQNRKRVRKYIHRLVWESFVGPIINEINHKNHIKSDNRLCNLEDISHSCNIQEYLKFHHITKKSNKCRLCGKVIDRKALHCVSCYKKLHNELKSNRPPKDVFIKELQDCPNLSHIGRKYGVSCTAVRKWMKFYCLNLTDFK